ncbi:MAG: aldose epimerase family protein [Chloroflexota bacterium]
MTDSERFSVTVERDPTFGVPAYVLRDLVAGSRARVLPALGNSLTSFVVALPGREQEVMLRPLPEERLPRATHYGNPILFPFPNRVRKGVFTFQKHTYRLDPNTAEGHHNHGLVRDQAWQVAAAGPTARGAELRSRIVGERFGEVMRQFPFPFDLSITYTLRDNSLRLDAVVRNTGSRPLPMGFGIHPYFQLPLHAGGRPTDCRLQIPATRMWVLDADKIPTGRSEAVPPALDFRTPRRMSEAELDHVFADLVREDGVATCRLQDPQAGAEVLVRFGPEFPVLVVYAPADRPTICFEPYTCLTDAANLQAAGVEAGLQVLPAGGGWRGSVLFAVRALADAGPA